MTSIQKGDLCEVIIDDGGDYRIGEEVTAINYLKKGTETPYGVLNFDAWEVEDSDNGGYVNVLHLRKKKPPEESKDIQETRNNPISFDDLTDDDGNKIWEPEREYVE